MEVKVLIPHGIESVFIGKSSLLFDAVTLDSNNFDLDINRGRLKGVHCVAMMPTRHIVRLALVFVQILARDELEVERQVVAVLLLLERVEFAELRVLLIPQNLRFEHIARVAVVLKHGRVQNLPSIYRKKNRKKVAKIAFKKANLLTNSLIIQRHKLNSTRPHLNWRKI